MPETPKMTPEQLKAMELRIAKANAINAAMVEILKENKPALIARIKEKLSVHGITVADSDLEKI